MRYLSLFSGMEAAHLALHPLGWECVGVSEIEKNACALLADRLPKVPNLGSVSDITAERIRELGPIDVVIGGSPCQDLSVAGKRRGLEGARSSLFHEQIRIFDAARTVCGARWLLWENVPGAFSSNDGRDFACVVGTMAGLGVSVPADGWRGEGVCLGPNGLVEWSLLDAQWFGLAQRRKRLFAVLDSGNWTDRAPVLLERESVRGDSPPSREAREGSPSNAFRGADFSSELPEVVGTLKDGAHNGGGLNGQDAYTGRVIPIAFDTTQITHPENRCNPQPGDPCHPLAAHAHAPAIAFNIFPSSGQGADLKATETDVASAMNPTADARSTDRGTRLVDSFGVRRLTPRECERAQGAPDDWTRVHRMKDGPRYSMLGNSFAVPVIRWIGEQIQRAQAESAP